MPTGTIAKPRFNRNLRGEATRVDSVGMPVDSSEMGLLARVGKLLGGEFGRERAIRRLQPREFGSTIEQLERDVLSKVKKTTYFVVDTRDRVYVGPVYSRREVVIAARHFFPDKNGIDVISNEPELRRLEPVHQAT